MHGPGIDAWTSVSIKVQLLLVWLLHFRCDVHVHETLLSACELVVCYTRVKGPGSGLRFLSLLLFECQVSLHFIIRDSNDYISSVMYCILLMGHSGRAGTANGPTLVEQHRQWAHSG